MKNEVLLKRALFGGFDRRQVMEYIAYLQQKSEDIRQEKQLIGALGRTLEELKEELAEKENIIMQLNTAVSEAEARTQLARSSAALMQQTVTYTDMYVENAKALAREISQKTGDCVDTSREKVDGLLGSLSEISDSVLELYSSLDALKAEYEDFGLIYIPGGLPGTPGADEDADDEAPSPEAESCAADCDEIDAITDEEDLTEYFLRMEEKYRSMLPLV